MQKRLEVTYRNQLKLWPDLRLLHPPLQLTQVKNVDLRVIMHAGDAIPKSGVSPRRSRNERKMMIGRALLLAWNLNKREEEEENERAQLKKKEALVVAGKKRAWRRLTAETMTAAPACLRSADPQCDPVHRRRREREREGEIRGRARW